tara:strand:- start:625 stop:855 length:231 start_codon:yes stop_codon:yes gene_type:complete
MTDWAKYPLEVMARGMVLNDEEVREMCAHIDAQDAKIKALVEAGTDLLGAIDMLMPKDGPAKLRMRAAIAAAKETT